MHQAVQYSIRQRMFRLLYYHGRLTATKLFTRLIPEQSVGSHYLGLLRWAGFVEMIRNDVDIHFTVNEQGLGKA